MDTAYSLQIYENCGEKATFSFFLKKEEKNPNGNAWNGENRKAVARSGKRKGRKDAKCGNPGNEKRGRSRGERPDAGMKHQARNAGSATA
jgi:hypothetical protein